MKNQVLPFRSMKAFSPLFLALAFLLGGLSFQSCSPKFSQKALDNATKLATSLPKLMEKATENYSSNESAVKTALADISSARSFASGIKRNREVAEQWRIFEDEIAKPFFDRWKQKGKLDNDFIKEAVKQVKGSLEAITKAERAKMKK